MLATEWSAPPCGPGAGAGRGGRGEGGCGMGRERGGVGSGRSVVGDHTTADICSRGEKRSYTHSNKETLFGMQSLFGRRCT